MRANNSEASEHARLWDAAGALRRKVGFDAWCWVPFDPATHLPAGAHVGCNPAFRGTDAAPRLVLLEFGERADFNDTRELARRGRAVGVLSAATEGDLRRSRRWAEVLAPAGLGDELRMPMVSAGACWGCLILFRERRARHFSEADALAAQVLADPLAGATRRLMVDGLPAHAPADGPDVLVLDPVSRRWSGSKGVARWLRGLSRPDGESGRMNSRKGLPELPAIVFALAARLCAIERDGPSYHPPARVRCRTTDGTWLTLSASRLSGDVRGGDVAITFEAARPADLLPLILTSRALTRREQELVGLVLRGRSTKAIADELRISTHTVQDHLKTVFGKTGVRSRRDLVALLAPPQDRVG